MKQPVIRGTKIMSQGNFFTYWIFFFMKQVKGYVATEQRNGVWVTLQLFLLSGMNGCGMHEMGNTYPCLREKL